MNIEKLEKLRDIVAAVPPENFNQERWPRPGESDCGCAGFHAEMNGLSSRDSTAEEDFGVSRAQGGYIFGLSDRVKFRATQLGFDAPTSFGPKDAAKRIQQIIDMGKAA